MDERSPKRRRLDDAPVPVGAEHVNRVWGNLASLARDISPPRRKAPEGQKKETKQLEPMDDDTTEDEDDEDAFASSTRTNGHRMNSVNKSSQPPQSLHTTKLLPSPIQLTRIRDLPNSHNVDTISLHDILGHPLLKECWHFNYLLSIPFIISHLDPDVASQVSLKIVHGFWKRDDPRRESLHEQAEHLPNVRLIAAHMPEMYGTHHSKMMVLIRHDDVAQVIIHTANMIPQDWGNLTQAVWRSPELPLLLEEQIEEAPSGEIGMGTRFKCDLLRYLKAYDGRTRSLVDQLRKYDFSAVRAALIASVPTKAPLTNQSDIQTSFGWPGLKQILSKIPAWPSPNSTPMINIQVSSIATLTEKWIQNFLTVLETQSRQTSVALDANKKTIFNVIFPVASEIKNSLDGYASGNSIHTKIQSKAQQKQLDILRPIFCHWSSENVEKKEALRSTAAPHIKTYIGFRSQECKEIDWAMVTSANLSTQAWGAVGDQGNTVRICSYEIGVVVWPDLFKENDEEEAVMVPIFGKDMPDESEKEKGKTVTGFRMPYDLPLTRYENDEVPWVASMKYSEPDRHGRVREGYENRM